MSSRQVWVLVQIEDYEVFDEDGMAFVLQESRPVKVFQQLATAEAVRDKQNQEAVGTGVYYKLETVVFI
jgi:hypothetical protein